MPRSKDLREFIELLNTNNVEFLEVGRFAVAWHGHPRFTADIDFSIQPTRANADLVVNTLREFGFGGLRVAADDLCERDRVLQPGVKPNRIDLITSVAGLSLQEAWDSRVAGTIDSVPMWFIGCDALIR